jgi:hypothetical protein
MCLLALPYMSVCLPACLPATTYEPPQIFMKFEFEDLLTHSSVYSFTSTPHGVLGLAVLSKGIISLLSYICPLVPNVNVVSS